MCPPFTGGSLLTILVARVRKIINADEDIPNCSNNAAFVIAVATEMFIQHLVDRTYDIVKSEKKPRRNVQYNDVGAFNDRVEIAKLCLTMVQPMLLLASTISSFLVTSYLAQRPTRSGRRRRRNETPLRKLSLKVNFQMAKQPST